MALVQQLETLWRNGDQLDEKQRLERLAELLLPEVEQATKNALRNLPDGVLATRFGRHGDRVELHLDIRQEFISDLLGYRDRSSKNSFEYILLKSNGDDGTFRALMNSSAVRLVTHLREKDAIWNLTKRAITCLEGLPNVSAFTASGRKLFQLPQLNRIGQITNEEISRAAQQARQLPKLETTATIKLPRLFSSASLEAACLILLSSGTFVDQNDIRRFFSEVFTTWHFSGLENSEEEFDKSAEPEIADFFDNDLLPRARQLLDSLDVKDLKIIRGMLMGTKNREIEIDTGLTRQQIHRRRSRLEGQLHDSLEPLDADEQERLAEMIHVEVARKIAENG